MPSEANYSYTVKIAGQHLFTIRGDDWASFATNVDTVLDHADLVAEKLTTLAALGNAAPLVNVDTTPPPQPAAAAAPGWGTPPPAQQQAAPPAFAQASVPSCSHGPRIARSGSSAKGPWKSWFCSAPQGTPRDQQCAAIFVDKKDAAAWNNHPA